MSYTGAWPKEISDKLRGVYEYARIQTAHEALIHHALLCS